MKKSFTLIEILISITLFSIVLLFLYQSLDITKTSNKFYENKLNTLIKKNNIKKLFQEDIAQASALELAFDNNDNTVLNLKSSNMFHNSFYKYVTYLISKEDSLMRIESLTKFDKSSLNETFFANAYIDTIAKNIEKLEVAQAKDNADIYTILYKQETNERVFFSALKIDTTPSK